MRRLFKPFSILNTNSSSRFSRLNIPTRHITNYFKFSDLCSRPRIDLDYRISDNLNRRTSDNLDDVKDKQNNGNNKEVVLFVKSIKMPGTWQINKLYSSINCTYYDGIPFIKVNCKFNETSTQAIIKYPCIPISSMEFLDSLNLSFNNELEKCDGLMLKKYLTGIGEEITVGKDVAVLVPRIDTVDRKMSWIDYVALFNFIALFIIFLVSFLLRYWYN